MTSSSSIHKRLKHIEREADSVHAFQFLIYLFLHLCFSERTSWNNSLPRSSTQSPSLSSKLFDEAQSDKENDSYEINKQKPLDQNIQIPDNQHQYISFIKKNIHKILDLLAPMASK
jgi:hypothetical protein